jgi:hypothetical protein
MFRRAVIAAALVAAPLAFAAPAMATPSFQCSPCESVPALEQLTSGNPWETIWPGADKKGAWENSLPGSWEKNLPGGWEKATANAPMA